MKNYVITIARGFGSGGRKIAIRLADELGIAVYDNALYSLAARYSGYDESLFPKEKLSGNSITRLLSQFSISSIHPEKGFVSDQRLFDIQSEIIRQLADTKSCVIVGKCADWVLRDYNNVLSIYTEAPREFCVKSVMSDFEGITEKKANELITATDLYRADYYRYYTGGRDWTNVVNYDLTINTGRLTMDQAVSVIIHALDLKFPVTSALPDMPGLKLKGTKPI